MAKAFSLASWNVEHFKKKGSRVDRVEAFLSKQNPDVFALYEVEGSEVFQEMTDQMPGYTFHITEGPQIQEILVGVRHGFTAFFTQKLEFKEQISALRPGALLTLTVNGEHYPILFLHPKSGSDPKGLGLRDDMLVKACDFRKTLNKAAGGTANYMFLGDLNTMGMRYRYVASRNIAQGDELTKLRQEAKRVGMRLLEKDQAHTWSNGSKSTIPPSNLDQVIVADHLTFKAFSQAEVSVRGWPTEQNTAKQDAWIASYSDHALLYLEVQAVE